MPISIQVNLLSGRTVSVEADLDDSVRKLGFLVQKALKVGRGCLLDSSGSTLDEAAKLGEAGLKSGDSLIYQVSTEAFAAVLGDGSVVTWGFAVYGGDRSAVHDQLKNVQQIQANRGAFAAILQDGSVVTWGWAEHGGDSSDVQDQLKNVHQIQASDTAFAAILGDGSVVAWGDAFSDGDSSAVQDLLKNVQQIQASTGAFAAILADGSVVTWGMARNVLQIQASERAFAAILSDGSVVTWGEGYLGGDSSDVQDELTNVQQIQGAEMAFAAILGGGSVVTWGAGDFGGDCSTVQDQLKNVQQIQSSSNAFAAILGDGCVVTWGSAAHGGDSSAVQDQLKTVRCIQATYGAFAAILDNGSVVTWGNADHGGDCSAVQDQLQDVDQIQASQRSFAAILGNGSVVTWGDGGFGGDSSAVQQQLMNCDSGTLQWHKYRTSGMELCGLEISRGRGGSCLSHSHRTQYTFVLQSLLLWREIMGSMFALWQMTEEDLLDPSSTYRLCDTGQGLNRVQHAPRVSRAMHQILHKVQNEVGNWVGLSVVHLGDRDVPNALVFIDKYTQVPRILGPLVRTLDKLPEVYNSTPAIKTYIDTEFKGVEVVRMAIMQDAADRACFAPFNSGRLPLFDKSLTWNGKGKIQADKSKSGSKAEAEVEVLGKSKGKATCNAEKKLEACLVVLRAFCLEFCQSRVNMPLLSQASQNSAEPPTKRQKASDEGTPAENVPPPPPGPPPGESLATTPKAPGARQLVATLAATAVLAVVVAVAVDAAAAAVVAAAAAVDATVVAVAAVAAVVAAAAVGAVGAVGAAAACACGCGNGCGCGANCGGNCGAGQSGSMNLCCTRARNLIDEGGCHSVAKGDEGMMGSNMNPMAMTMGMNPMAMMMMGAAMMGQVMMAGSGAADMAAQQQKLPAADDDDDEDAGLWFIRFVGRIKFWFENKGFGFIESEEFSKVFGGDSDVFLHHFQKKHYQRGDLVEFSVFTNFRGKPQGTELRKVKEDSWLEEEVFSMLPAHRLHRLRWGLLDGPRLLSQVLAPNSKVDGRQDY
eukprot:s1651_g9.t1